MKGIGEYAFQTKYLRNKVYVIWIQIHILITKFTFKGTTTIQ